MHDWFRIMQLVQGTTHSVADDELLMETYKHVGDYYADRQKWFYSLFLPFKMLLRHTAEKHYASGRYYEELLRCYTMTEDYEKLETLMRHIPEHHPLLPVRCNEMFV